MNKADRLFFPILCLIIMVPQLGLSLYVPALPAIQHFFVANNNQIALTMTSYLLGYAFSFLFIGILADHFGKKKTVIFSIILFFTSSSLIIFTHYIDWFIIWRFFQGIAAGGCAVSARALTKDLFSGKQLSQAMSSLSIAFVVAQGASLLIGGWLVTLLYWQFIFILMSVLTIILLLVIILFLPTPNKKAIPTPSNLAQQIITGYRTVLKSKGYLRFAFIASLGYGVVISFNVFIPFWAKHQVTLTADEFGLLGFLMSFIYLIGALLNKHFITEERINDFLLTGILLLSLSGISMLLLSLCWPTNIYSISPLFLSMLVLAFIYPNAAVRALEQPGINSGNGVACIGFIQQSFGAVVSFFAGLLLSPHHSLFWLALNITLIGIILVLLVSPLVRNRLHSTS